MTNNDTAHLVLGHGSMHYQAEAQKDPWKIWGLEDKQTQETKQGIGILSTPDVYERAAEG